MSRLIGKLLVARKITCYTLVLVAFLACFGTSLFAKEHHFTAVVLNDFPPLYVTNESGRPDGFALDILHAVAMTAGLDYNVKVVNNWAGAMEAVRSGQADVVPGIGVSPTREDEFLFTDIFLTIPISCFVRDDTYNIKSIDDLSGHRVAVIDRSAAQTRLGKNKKIRLITYHSIDECLFSLLAGTVDAFVFPEPTLWKKARDIGVDTQIKVVGQPLMELKRAYLLRKDDSELAARLNKALQQYVASSAFADTYLKWWGQPEPFWSLPRILLVAVLTTLFIAGLLVIWRYLSVTVLNKELKETRDSLKASEQRLNRAQDVAFLGSFERDLVKNQALWSEGLFKLMGYDAGSVVPSLKMFLAMIHPDDRDAYTRGIDQASPEHPDYTVEFRFKPQGSDEYRHATCRYTYEFAENGTPLKRIGAIQDITDRKLIEAELVEAMEAAEAASNAKSEFLANMSHELRTPLNGAMGMMQLMAMDELHPTHREYVETSLTSCKNLTQLLGDILDLSKVEAGKMELTTEEFGLDKILASVHETFARLAEDKGLIFEFNRASDVPDCLEGDPARLRQVLFNLVGNALKFTETGSVKVEVSRLEAEQADGCRLLFSVIDTGIGIPDDMVGNIFGAFIQGDGAHTRKYEGTGLGLHIVKRLSELMDGHVSVESGAGLGTTIHFSAFFGLSGDIEDQCAPDATISTIPPRRILVVEDERVNRLAICKFLQRMGHTVEWVSNGLEALRKVALEDFDLIFMDIQMPVMTGIEATKRIRGANNLGPKKDIPIIALTAHTMSGDREAFLDAGMNDYLSKPVDVTKLKQVLARNLTD